MLLLALPLLALTVQAALASTEQQKFVLVQTKMAQSEGLDAKAVDINALRLENAELRQEITDLRLEITDLRLQENTKCSTISSLSADGTTNLPLAITKTTKEKSGTITATGLVVPTNLSLARRKLVACPDWKEASHPDLQNQGPGLEDGVNYVSASCDVGLDTEIQSGQTYKIAKHPNATGEVAVDRKATSDNRGLHFKVNSGGTLEMTGLTLKGGYVSDTTNFFNSI